MPEENIKYDVAISFLSQDVAIAQAIHDKLAGGFDVFFFPRNQEELAATNGMESMRAAFRHESRLNVVVYRPKWGKTPWTAVEEQAIIDSCLHNQYKSIFLYVVEKTTILPTWLPENYIYFSATHYPLEEAVGAIKARVQERGGEYRPLTPIKKAELNQAEEDYRRAKSALSSELGTTLVFAKVKELFTEISRHIQEVNDAGDHPIQRQFTLKEGEREQSCLLGRHRVGMGVYWYQPWGNSLDKAILAVREFNENIILPAGRIRFTQPGIVGETRYDLDLSRTLEIGWQPQRGDKSFISSNTLASQLVIQFLDLIDRDAAGKVTRKSS
jgi:hypothetical protein